MLDINLGNKTLVIGVLIALILSYGMVNFDSGSGARSSGPAIQAALENVSTTDSSLATASAAEEATPTEGLDSTTSTSASQTAARPSTGMLRQMEKEKERQERM